jgi:hypothetical protein
VTQPSRRGQSRLHRAAVADGGEAIDPQQRQQFARTWATGCGDLIEQMHRLTAAIGEDALALFQNGNGAGESRAIGAATP